MKQGQRIAGPVCFLCHEDGRIATSGFEQRRQTSIGVGLRFAQA